MIDPELLAILACPRCDDRPPLEAKGTYLVCTVCRTGYPVVDGIPHLLVESGVEPQLWEKEVLEQKS